MYRRIYTVPVDAETGRRLARICRAGTPLRRLVASLLRDALDRLQPAPPCPRPIRSRR